ncbi:4'-phosphopantetheinyl transferase superfamily protein [Massilia forsythiae]|uniref:4'-phosphopantetheinyl transferase superfamily protein n=1 Tax=Massilia forsythiae TaxID=2728020 RepID=A0A7Z2ZTT8_9BURK|nr:4'-phosphopantetheinyl transferase superfamily protein [Massilia forsythiae]QJE01615.1 4'-phosphopantetheinyl transferase superfamily protein [Massilia forsythiae]
MTPVGVHWWEAQRGFAPDLPGSDPLFPIEGRSRDAAAAPAVAPGALVIGVRGRDAGRNAARHAIRQALGAALARLTGLAPARIVLRTLPGQAPHALLDPDGDGGRRRVALSISHDGDLSLAAIRTTQAGGNARGGVGNGAGSGGVGIDLMRSAAIPDWRAVAHDYLGPDAARRLAGLPDAQRPMALARAWSEREARLKCLGLPLAEWDGADARRIDAAIACLPLDVPAPYCGALALG